MYRGSTPDLIIHLSDSISLNVMDDIWVTLKNFYTKITKKYSEGQLEVRTEDNKIMFSLTQEESLSLSPGKAEIQVRLLTNYGKSYSTNIMTLNVEDILEEGVMSV